MRNFCSDDRRAFSPREADEAAFVSGIGRFRVPRAMLRAATSAEIAARQEEPQ
jgi:hypothetical protein